MEEKMAHEVTAQPMMSLYDVADRLAPFARPYVVRRLREEDIEYEKSGKRLRDLAGLKESKKLLWKEIFNPIIFIPGLIFLIALKWTLRKPSDPDDLPEVFLTDEIRKTTLLLASTWAQRLHRELRDHPDHQFFMGVNLIPEWGEKSTRVFLRTVNQLAINCDDAHAIFEDFGASLRLANEIVRFPFGVILEPHVNNEKPFLAKLVPQAPH